MDVETSPDRVVAVEPVFDSETAVPSSLQSRLATPEASVAVTCTVAGAVLNQPPVPSGDWVKAIVGAVVSQILVTDAVAGVDELPALSVDVALIVFGPQDSGTMRRKKVGAEKTAAAPLTVTPATPLVASVAVPLTLTDEEVVEDGSESNATVGFAVSRLIVCVFVL